MGPRQRGQIKQNFVVISPSGLFPLHSPVGKGETIKAAPFPVHPVSLILIVEVRTIAAAD